MLRDTVDDLKATMDAETARMKEMRKIPEYIATLQELKPIVDGLQKMKFDKAKAKYKAEHEKKLKRYYAARRKVLDMFPDGKYDSRILNKQYDELEQTHKETYEKFVAIFEMCMNGRGPSQITNQLKADGVLTPTAYKDSMGIKSPNTAPENPCDWHGSTVVAILERREYTGCTVNFKTYTNSIWDKKQRDNPIEKQAVFENAHEAIIEKGYFRQGADYPSAKAT